MRYQCCIRKHFSRILKSAATEHRSIWTPLLTLIIFASFSSSGFGQTCDPILRQGVFNQTTVNKGLSIQDDLFQWLKTATDEQWTSAKNSGLNFSATIYGSPVNLNGTSSLQEFHRLQTSIDQGLVTSLTQNEFLQTVQLSASTSIVNAWLACVRSSTSGLSCSHELNGNSIIVFSAKWGPNSITDYPPTVASGGFQVSSGGTYSGNALANGSEILISGSSVIVNRPGNDPVTILLNTTKGTCTVNVPAIATIPPPPNVPPPLNLELFTATSARSDLPQVTVSVPNAYKIISGGARDNYAGFGNMLTASYPVDLQHWSAQGKAHSVSDPSTIDAWAIALNDPENLWEVFLQPATSVSAHQPTATAKLPDGYTLTGGGAYINWAGGWGNLLTASYPQGSNAWFAAGTDHIVSDPAPITAYAIGIRPRNGSIMPLTKTFALTSGVAELPEAKVAVDSGYVMLGGGANVDWHGYANLLVSSYPSDARTWTATSKDHMWPYLSSASITAYAIGIDMPSAPTCTYNALPSSLALGAQASTVNVNITAPIGCRWNVATTPEWVSFPEAIHDGSGSTSFTVPENSATSPRSGVIQISSQGVIVGEISVAQQASPCAPFSISSLNASFPAEGALGIVNISGATGCTWNITGMPSWISVTNGSSGTGNGSVNFVVARNEGGNRTATLTVAGQTFTAAQSGSSLTQSTALRYIPITPCRVADTREANGPFGGPGLVGGKPRDFNLLTSSCGIPAAAQAYAMNVTVVPSGRLQYLTVWPSGQPQPLVSTLNSYDGRVKANAAIVPAGVGGTVSVFATDNTHLVLDVNGYFVPASDTSGLAFYPLTPCRMVDTRTSRDRLGQPSLAGRQPTL